MMLYKQRWRTSSSSATTSTTTTATTSTKIILNIIFILVIELLISCQSSSSPSSSLSRSHDYNIYRSTRNLSRRQQQKVKQQQQQQQQQQHVNNNNNNGQQAYRQHHQRHQRQHHQQLPQHQQHQLSQFSPSHPPTHHTNPHHHQQQQLPHIRGDFIYDSHKQPKVVSCSEENGFSSDQERFCRLHPDHVSTIFRATEMATDECFQQFGGMRWNCSRGNKSSFMTLPDYLPDGCKEASILKAFFSASMTFNVARACKDGQLSQCGCSRREKPRHLPAEWVWGGCGDNTEYGFKFGVGFVDSREREMNYPRYSHELKIMLSNLHNNMVGRRTVVGLSKASCRCHGASGSCSMKTCWHQMADFNEIARELKFKYENVPRLVKFNNAGTSLVLAEMDGEGIIEKEKPGQNNHANKYDDNFQHNSKKNEKRNPKSRKFLPQRQQQKQRPQVKPQQHRKHNVKQSKQPTHQQKQPGRRYQQQQYNKQRNNKPTRKSKTKKRRQQGGLGDSDYENVDNDDDTRPQLATDASSNRPTRDTLIYTEPSPDFCEALTNTSWPGTHGRQCKRGEPGSEGCDLMCCGRGYNTFREKVTERCRCHFVWCCSVHCSTCEKYIDVHVCK